jgi:hypothetical protein
MEGERATAGSCSEFRPAQPAKARFKTRFTKIQSTETKPATKTNCATTEFATEAESAAKTESAEAESAQG